jgi:hypothetical protein
MKKTSIYSILLILCGLLSLAGETKAEPGFEKVRGAGHTTAISQTAFQGAAELQVGGETLTANVTTVLLGPPTVTADGTLHAATSHTFSFTDGSSFVTLDRAVLSPTDEPGVYRLNTRATILDGTGIYADASGALNIHGTINLLTGVVDWRFDGRVGGER